MKIWSIEWFGQCPSGPRVMFTSEEAAVASLSIIDPNIRVVDNEIRDDDDVVLGGLDEFEVHNVAFDFTKGR